MSLNQQLATLPAGGKLMQPGMGTPQTIEHYGMDMITLAGHLAKSGYFADAKDASQAVVKVLYGMEIGVSPIASMTGIHVIEGKPSIGAGIMAAAIKRSKKYNFKVITSTDFDCQLEFFENGESVGTLGMTIEEATTAGLTTNGYGKPKVNWQRSPSDMLFARVLSRGQRRFAPDVFSTVFYTTEEMDDVSDKVINAAVTDATVPQPPTGRQKIDRRVAAKVADAGAMAEDDKLKSKNLEHGYGDSVPRFAKGEYPDHVPSQCPTEYLEQCIERWNGGTKVRPEMRAEVERVLAVRHEEEKQLQERQQEESPNTAAPITDEIPEGELVEEQVEAAPVAEPTSATASTPTAAPAPKKMRSSVKALVIACERAGLSMAPEFRAERIAAVNTFLEKAGNKERIESFSDLTDALAYKVMTDIQELNPALTWGLKTDDAAAPSAEDSPSTDAAPVAEEDAE